MLEQKESVVFASPPKDPSKIAGSIKLPIATINKSSLYSIRTKSDKNGAIEVSESNKEVKDVQKVKQDTFDNLSPNVKRIISSSGATTLKFQKKTMTVGRSSTRRCNIPLVGATSKISQSGVEILPSVEIHDHPSTYKAAESPAKEKETKLNEPVTKVDDSPAKIIPEFRIEEEQTTYDVPTNNRPAIYDVPTACKTAFESLSLPFIDQSIELSMATDREFDTKLQSKDNSPQKPEKPVTPESSPAKIPKTAARSNSLRKEITTQDSRKLLKNPYPETVGSTGNLKLSQEKEVRLNPAIEVTRPLSMSSIASSSSTSSSGVQNKGVNSAYLASIESLDDHSDVDITSANSNNFVNGILKSEDRSENSRQSIVDEMAGLSQLERVCAEIVQTENVYVEDLRQVVEGYLHVWRREATFSEDELSELFNNIEDIYAFNRSLCTELNSCKLDATCIARCFVNNTTGFSVYTSYCTGYPRTMERLAALASKPQSAREFRERQIDLRHPLPLASYLLKPVQRILKYHLLLQNVVKQCASSDTEYALSKMTGIAQHIDDMKRRHEHAVRVQEIQSLLYGWNGPDLTTYGELCAEGTFRVFGAKAMRHAFLFDKMLLVTKNREDGILAYKSHIMCNNMMLVESIAGAPLSFHVIPWDAPRSQLTLQARSPRHKREWTLLLKRVILENYNAVIPSHARQLVMELGQNKTDDDILAEKSHNLITQASMRKQLSAPEYLEKRKLERERRKSFESNSRGRSKKINRKYTAGSSRDTSRECDCAQVSSEKGIDYTCDNCYIDLCSDCEVEVDREKKEDRCTCQEKSPEKKCPECDKALQYIDAGSPERNEVKTSCKCSDFNSSQESFTKDFTSSLHKTRGYHSSDNIIDYVESKDLTDPKHSLTNVRSIQKTCLKCCKIKENIPVTDSISKLHARKSRCNDIEKSKIDTTRSKSKDDPQRSKLSKIGTWRRKSEPGLQQNAIIIKKLQDSDSDRNEAKGSEKIEFECRNCGSNKITRKNRLNEGSFISDSENDTRRKGNVKSNLEIKMYNTKNMPKKITKIKKNRAKGLRLHDTSARFYTDFSTDMSTENILHITESNDSLNTDKPKSETLPPELPTKLSKDEDIDEETYRKLVEKTDSFKKNELEKVKFLNKQKVINEGSETDDKQDVKHPNEDVQESCEETEQPLEQIISQLLLQNREFQKLLKKQQQRSSGQRRHQRLLKSYSTPEQAVQSKNDLGKLKPKYGRQLSENIDVDIDEQNNETEDGSDDDHIYETLRVESKLDKRPHANGTNLKDNVDSSQSFSSPRTLRVTESKNFRGPESDYVYLSFDEIKRRGSLDDGIYDVPVKTPEKVKGVEHKNDYYVTMEKQGPPTADENVYDSLIEVCRRKKEVPDSLPVDYLPMSPDQQSPNTPEIWLSRQKEHFNVSRDRKSGSLPRSFQVVTSGQEDSNLSTFKCKPNTNSKTYLNRDGKVVSADRPFTIASDQSEISYDDVETYMSEGDILKFNKNSKAKQEEQTQEISQSTLELEEEIDRCYKNNFERVNLDTNKNESIPTTLPNPNISSTSSCEALALEQNNEKSKQVDIIHPEHKIYKPTGNVLSLKNVISRFKNRTPPKNNEDAEVNANDIKNEVKSDLKSPTNEKRSALNPRSYSKNLLQRFRSIIGDEQPDDNQNKTESSKTSENEVVITKNDTTVVVTASSDNSPTTSANITLTDALSKSVHEQTTSDSHDKTNVDIMSQSCDNLSPKLIRPNFEKSVSMVTTMSQSAGNNSSPSKSSNSSYQSLNKLPIYMQGSKYLGARIAQSDYEDPMTLLSEKSALKNVNVLINKHAVRPDSLFSNSSFITSSSESTYHESKVVTTKTDKVTKCNSDENYYEKSFEKIEQVTDEDVFRDSAVYSDQEDDDVVEKPKTNKNVTKIENVQQNTSLKMPKSATSGVTSTTQSSAITTHVAKKEKIESFKPVKLKIAPPVPIKPKLSTIPSVQTITMSSRRTNQTDTVHQATKTVKPAVNRSESSPLAKNKTETGTKEGDKGKEEPKNSIQIKRSGFERASLDSATRKTRVVVEKNVVSEPKTSKSVLERRLEIEKMTTAPGKVNQSKKPVQVTRPKSITTKVASFERSVSISEVTVSTSVARSGLANSVVRPKNVSIPPGSSEDCKESWVKQVVNKFQ
ncbi:uncharacterized protein LOC121738080 isoform X2 [Aricia agestis]|nr:uncharacterized protein LOC121738080 isoform X2 [Aricia agestis]